MKIKPEASGAMALMLLLAGCGSDAIAPTQTPEIRYKTIMLSPFWEKAGYVPFKDHYGVCLTQSERESFANKFGVPLEVPRGSSVIDDCNAQPVQGMQKSTSTPTPTSQPKPEVKATATLAPKPVLETKPTTFRGTFRDVTYNYLPCTIAQNTGNPSCSASYCIDQIKWFEARPQLISVDYKTCKASKTAAR